MSVIPSIFVAAMSKHWTQKLNNVSSPALCATWDQLAHTFDRQIVAHGTPEGQRWKVLQPATGTGKTQGLAVYCSLLDAADHPGVLIVTRLKTQADGIAADINAMAGKPGTALAYHGDNRVPVTELPLSPVLISLIVPTRSAWTQSTVINRMPLTGVGTTNGTAGGASSWSSMRLSTSSKKLRST
jgi:hypothetical protein